MFLKKKPITIAVANLGLILAHISLATVAAPALAHDENSADSGAPLPEVMVTATRSTKAVEKIPGALSVITARELEAQYLIADDPSAALAVYVPGYAPSRQKMTSTGESLRGRQPLILLDGIPQSNPLRAGMREGYFADSAIIERIEVINGASAIQGMGATGGIINYISKVPRKNGTEQGLHTRLSSQFRNDSMDWKAGYSIAHKNDDFDMLAYAGVQQRGIAYDGAGRRVGVDSVQGDAMDTGGQDLFLKLGKSLGAQRLQFSLNRFTMEGDGDYRTQNADLKAGIPTTSVPGTPPGKPARNEVQSLSLDYRHAELAGGALAMQLFKQDFTSLYGATNASTFQDARLGPAGSVIDQSEIVADKTGARITWVRPDVLLQGLELTVGADRLHDNTQQRLALSDRVWVPPLDFRSSAPFVQFEYEAGALTLRGGLRREFADLHVDTYTTLAAYGSRQVEGGNTDFAETVQNLGAIWRFAPGWSVFVSNAEGFGLPDAGLVLRGVNRAGQTVASLIDLQPIVTRNKEIGFVWRGKAGNAAISYYDSRSDLGSVIRVTDGIGRVDRVPTVVKGWEASAEWKLTGTLSVFGSLARTNGKTATTQGAPIDVALSARNQGPDKVVLGTNWEWLPKSTLRLQATRLADRDINIGRYSGSSKLEEHFTGYTLVDAALGFDTAYGRFGVSLENLFDRQYVGYYAQSAAVDPLINTFAGRGRTLALSWSQKF